MGARGAPKTGGRGKGVKNKANHVRDLADRLGIDPFKVLLYFAAGDWQALGYEKEKIEKHSAACVNEEFVIEPSVRARAAAEACQYLHPKLKSVEHSGEIGGGEGAQITISIPDNGFAKK